MGGSRTRNLADGLAKVGGVGGGEGGRGELQRHLDTQGRTFKNGPEKTPRHVTETPQCDQAQKQYSRQHDRERDTTGPKGALTSKCLESSRGISTITGVDKGVFDTTWWTPANRHATI